MHYKARHFALILSANHCANNRLSLFVFQCLLLYCVVVIVGLTQIFQNEMPLPKALL
jgi:hypothetical protein